ncbi:MAG: phosphatase PAP2 family protein [Rikenellaceae bacterium]
MKYWALILLIAITFNAAANGSESVAGESCERVDFTKSKTYEILHTGVPLIVAGFALKPACKEFQYIRKSNFDDTRFYADDYIQYSPAALMIALKAVGIESRSSWGRMLTSSAMSVAVGSMMLNSVKRTANVHRPDSGSNTSMPSGHTATAFMVATMLHKEYGARSPWYSIAGYSIAAATGAMRVVNNKHWVSDVMVGAGIGIIGTELGYFLTDLIFKDKGINKEFEEEFCPTWYNISSKSSLGFYLGVTTPLNQLSSTAEVNTGSRIGLDYSNMLFGNFGLGADLSLNTFSIDLEGEMQEQYLEIISTNIGGYYAQPISRRWRVGAKALVGMDYYKECGMEDELNISDGGHFAFGTGLSMEYLTNRHWSVKAFCDYNAALLHDLPKASLHQTAIFGVRGNIIF